MIVASEPAHESTARVTGDRHTTARESLPILTHPSNLRRPTRRVTLVHSPYYVVKARRWLVLVLSNCTRRLFNTHLAL